MTRRQSTAPQVATDLLVQRPGIDRFGTGRRLMDADRLLVPLHELVDGCLRARVALLVDLVDESAAHSLRFRGRLRPSWHRLDEVVPATAERVDARVHAHQQRAARSSLDLAALTPAWLAVATRHGKRGSTLAP